MTAPAGGPAIEASGVVKSFGTVQALRGVDLTVPSGSLTALLGPNGAGKTTLVRIFATLLRPDSGTVRVLGRDVTAFPYAVRSGIGLTGQYAGLDEALRGRDNLMLIGRLAGGPASSPSASAWPTRPGERCAPTPAACAVGWTWRPA